MEKTYLLRTLRPEGALHGLFLQASAFSAVESPTSLGVTRLGKYRTAYATVNNAEHLYAIYREFEEGRDWEYRSIQFAPVDTCPIGRASCLVSHFRKSYVSREVDLIYS